MFGWRARIGALIVHTNATMEAEFRLVAPEGVSIHASRIPISAIDVQSLLDARSHFEYALKLLSELDASSYVLAATAATFVGGSEYDEEAMRAIREITGGRPFVTAAKAGVQALRAMGAKRIAVGTAYSDELNLKLKAFLEESGFQIARMVGFDEVKISSKPPLSLSDASHTGILPAEFAYKVGRLAYTPGVDALYLAPIGMRTMTVIDALEKDLGLPVITSAQATFWAGLRAAGIREKINGFGSLLHDVEWVPDH